VVRYDLGALGDAADPQRLGFTDATPFGGGGVLYVAAAEASADVYEDGPVGGSALGVIDADGAARMDAAGRRGRRAVRREGRGRGLRRGRAAVGGDRPGRPRAAVGAVPRGARGAGPAG
jgi:hypothetical protein